MGGKGSGGAHNPNGAPHCKPAVLEPKTAARTAAMASALMDVAEIDLNDRGALRERLGWYFDLCSSHCLKPTVSGLGMALGINSGSLRKIASGEIFALDTNNPQWTTSRERNLSRESADLIKKAYELLEVMWEANFQEGSIQPVVGIFLAKNNYGYRDQVENVIVPKNPLGEAGNPEEIVERYAKSLPEPDGGRLPSD